MKKGKKPKLYYFFIAVIIIFAYAGMSKVTSKIEWKTFANNYYSFSYPTSLIPIDLKFTYLLKFPGTNPGLDGISFTLKPLTLDEDSLEKIKQNYLKNIQEIPDPAFRNVQKIILGIDEVKLDGHDALKIEHVEKLILGNGELGFTPHEICYFIILREENKYLQIRFRANESESFRFYTPKNLVIFDKIIQSLTIQKVKEANQFNWDK